MPLVRSQTILQYGPGSAGKTVATIRALRPAGVFYLALEPGAFTPMLDPDLNPWRDKSGNVQLPPDDHFAELLDMRDPFGQLKRCLEERVLPAIEQGKVGAVAMSTLSAFAERYYDQLMGMSRKDGYQDQARFVARRCRELLNMLFEVGPVLIVEAHERGFSRAETGEVKMGGPKFVEHNNSVQGLCAMFDTVLRASYTTLPGTRVKVRFYECDPKSNEHEGRQRDRWNVCRLIEPMDLKVIITRARQKALFKPLDPPAEFDPAIFVKKTSDGLV